jgi:hypothetical protein
MLNKAACPENSGKSRFLSGKKLILILTILLVCYCNSYAQTNGSMIQIYYTDSANVYQTYKIFLLQAGYKNFYVQLNANWIEPYNPDFRFMNIFRLNFANDIFYDNYHNGALHNTFDIGYGGIDIGHTLDFNFSRRDTNLLLFSKTLPWWEPMMDVYCSTNNGLNYSKVVQNEFMTNSYALAIDQRNDSVMYAAISEASATPNIFKTTNRGTNWFVVDTISLLNYNTGKMYVSPYNRNVVYLAYSGKLYRSTQAGYNFQTYYNDSVNCKTMIFSQTDRISYLVNASPRGILKSTNNGNTWTKIFNKPCNDLEIDPLNGNIFYAATGEGIFKSANKGVNWSLYNNTFPYGNNIAGLVKRPDKGDTIYAANSKGVYKVFGQSLMDTASAKYLPLAVGNIYVYLIEDLPFPTISSKMKTKITQDSVIGGKRYFYISNPPIIGNNWIRYDSLTGCAVAYSTNGGCFPFTNDKIIDSLAAKFDNQSTGCIFSFYQLRRCVDTSNIILFGAYPTKKKGFYHDGLLVGGATYVRNFGLYRCYATELGYGTLYTLQGCVLNGVVYGDTTLTGISNNNTKLPGKYSLSQNYPNPFNPTTKIRFAIPAPLSFPNAPIGNPGVMLKIYDINGREIQTLVNEKLNPGTYEVTFDGSNYASGIYFYRLTTDDFSDTKKLILLK